MLILFFSYFLKYNSYILHKISQTKTPILFFTKKIDFSKCMLINENLIQ